MKHLGQGGRSLRAKFAEWSSLAERPVLSNIGCSRSTKELARGAGRGIEGRIAACRPVVVCVSDGVEAHRTTVRTMTIHHPIDQMFCSFPAITGPVTCSSWGVSRRGARSHPPREHDRRRSTRRMELEFSNRYRPHLNFCQSRSTNINTNEREHYHCR